MARNEGTLDRLLRIALGIALLSQVFAVHVWGWIGVIPLLTGTLGWCPLYRVLGINTCRICRTKEARAS